MKKQLLFLLLCASISFNGMAQNSISYNPIISTTPVGTTLTVNYKYTADRTVYIFCGLNKYDNWTWMQYIGGQGSDPTHPAGTDVTGSFSIVIPTETTPSDNLPSPQNYKLVIEMKDPNDNFQFLVGAYEGIQLTTALGINNFNLMNELSVYPNPVTDILKIANADTLANASFSIVDILGKTVVQSKALSNSAIDVSNLSSGVYVLSVSSEDGAKQFKFQKK